MPGNIFCIYDHHDDMGRMLVEVYQQPHDPGLALISGHVLALFIVTVIATGLVRAQGYSYCYVHGRGACWLRNDHLRKYFRPV